MANTKNVNASQDGEFFDFRKIDDIIRDAPVTTVAPKSKEDAMSPEQVNEVIKVFATSCRIPIAAGFVAMALLMLKGAANAGTPESMYVEVCKLAITKGDLLLAYEKVTGNRHIRRLAEAAAVQISRYAEQYGLDGDLAKRLNTRLRADTGENLSPKEMAWANSFCQNVPNLGELSSERLCKLLAEDFNSRFSKAQKKQGPPAKKAAAPKNKEKGVNAPKKEANASNKEANANNPVPNTGDKKTRKGKQQ